MSALDQSRVLPVSARRLRLPAVLVGLVTIVVSTAGWAYGQLVNPGFEDSGGSLVGWQDFGNTIGNVTVSSLTPRSGSWAASVDCDDWSSFREVWSGPPTTVPTFSECRSSPRRIRRRHTAGPV